MEGFGIRLNKSPPEITVKKLSKGGVSVNQTVKLTKLSDATIQAICKEYRVPSAEVTFRSDATADDLIDVLEGNRVYIPCLYVLNKMDSITIEELDILDKIPHYVIISGRHGWNIDELLETVWKYLDMIRVYTKPRGQIPDYDAPVVLPRHNRTVGEFCSRIHKDLFEQFKYAWVWGASVKHNPQRVGIDHELQDEDVVQIVKKYVPILTSLFILQLTFSPSLFSRV